MFAKLRHTPAILPSPCLLGSLQSSQFGTFIVRSGWTANLRQTSSDVTVRLCDALFELRTATTAISVRTSPLPLSRHTSRVGHERAIALALSKYNRSAAQSHTSVVAAAWASANRHFVLSSCSRLSSQSLDTILQRFRETARLATATFRYRLARGSPASNAGCLTAIVRRSALPLTTVTPRMPTLLSQNSRDAT